MPIVKTVKTIQDFDTFTLNEADLTGKKVDEFLETPQRDVPCADGLRWWIRCFPAGVEDAEGYTSLFLHVNNDIRAKFIFSVDGSSIHESCTYDFSTDWPSDGFECFASHGALRPYFHIGKLQITCHIEFEIDVPYICVKPCLFLSSDHVPRHDFCPLSECVYKHFLSLMSPVFNAMFTHDTTESKSGKVKITDFDYETVKAAIDFCYGREFKNPCIDTFVGTLRFADKYDIKAVTSQLAQVPELNLSTDSFCTIAHYAYDCSKEDLFAECCQYFEENQSRIKIKKGFENLPAAFVVHLLKTSFELKSDFDVLRHAHENCLKFVTDHLEQPLLEGLSIDNFCATVTYAWDYQRDVLKKMCAEFMNDNRDEIMNLKGFCELSGDTLRGLMKLRYDIENSDE
uniref:BTB domain-containing protein n=1 Tax=Panagrellus redivivus TaxID=6233 RepID=A0A7E4W6E3_PANRE